MTTFVRTPDHDAPAVSLTEPFGELVAALRAIDFRTTAAEPVAKLLRTVRLDGATLAPYVHFATGRYTRTCVFREPRFELLVLCWPESLRSPIHDHGGSRCFLRVAQGALRVDNFSIVEGARRPGYADLAYVDTQLLAAGAVDSLGSERDIHQVGAVTGEAVSLHLYAAPLDRCLVFDREQMTCRVALSRYDRPPAR